MWEEGMTTKPQIYYKNKHASTPQASKKKASQMKTMYIGNIRCVFYQNVP